MPADVEKEEVGDDDEQRGDADDELYQQFRRVGKMSLDEPKAGAMAAPAMTVSSDIDRMVSVNFLFTTLICLLL